MIAAQVSVFVTVLLVLWKPAAVAAIVYFLWKGVKLLSEVRESLAEIRVALGLDNKATSK